MEKMDFLPPIVPNLIFECETYMAYTQLHQLFQGNNQQEPSDIVGKYVFLIGLSSQSSHEAMVFVFRSGSCFVVVRFTLRRSTMVRECSYTNTVMSTNSSLEGGPYSVRFSVAKCCSSMFCQPLWYHQNRHYPYPLEIWYIRSVHSFMRRPVHPSFGWVKTIVDG